eukprot:scaffold314660_cov14-Prasinocladus_malaysianus.AAC.1
MSGVNSKGGAITDHHGDSAAGAPFQMPRYKSGLVAYYKYIITAIRRICHRPEAQTLPGAVF